MVCVYAVNRVADDKVEEFIAIALKLVGATVKEDGNITYEFCKKEDLYIFFERWENEKALEKHMNTSEFNRYVPMLEAIRLEGSTTVTEKLF